MTPKPQKVLIIGSGPIVIGQAAASLCRRFVYDTPGAYDLAEEGITSRLVVLAGGVANGS